LELESEFKVIEATSNCLEIAFFPEEIADAVILTGIERYEHDEIHGNFERYISVKRKIYELRKPGAKAFVCSDDSNFYELTKSIDNIITYGFSSDSSFSISAIKQDREGILITISYGNNKIDIASRLVGKHNATNITAVFCVLKELGFSEQEIKRSIESFPGTSGRFEKYEVKTSSMSKLVIIDYAHTPRSLRLNLELIREIYPDKSVCTIFGCGGQKSKSKRAPMGSTASRLSDHVILTNDNPRSEDPRLIIEGIRVNMADNYKIIFDRLKAIEAALDNSHDIIFLAGKGSEDYYIDSKGWHAGMSDRELLKRACNKKSYKMFSI